MRRRALFGSRIKVSAIGLGCWGMSGSYGPADEVESVATLHHALDLGVDFIDTADSYGDRRWAQRVAHRSGPEGSPSRIHRGDMRRSHPDENVAAVEIELTPEELTRLDVAFQPGAATGDRYTPEVARWAGR